MNIVVYSLELLELLQIPDAIDIAANMVDQYNGKITADGDSIQ
jgi:hypothetical protein